MHVTLMLMPTSSSQTRKHEQRKKGTNLIYLSKDEKMKNLFVAARGKIEKNVNAWQSPNGLRMGERWLKTSISE